MVLTAVVVVQLLLGGCRREKPPPLVVHAAASLSVALPAVAEAFRAQGGPEVTFRFDASSRLARQLESGAPGDVFISADEAWMDHLASRSLLAPETRRHLARGRLVVVVPASAKANVSGLTDLRELPRVALAGESVPAGRYARAALARAGVERDLVARAIHGDDVRTVLAWVARGEVDAGIVYATDARSEPRVRVAFVIAETEHPPIVYPGAVLASATSPEKARAFLDFCLGAGAAPLRDAGFEPPAPP
jgi:molybdate transport system substrate-binding protein